MKLIIDGAKVKNKEILYAQFADKLRCEREYIGNLDALYDVLSERADMQIIIRNSEILRVRFREFYEILLSVFKESDTKILIL